ncbi:helix-turn-helix domain-containing protein [Ornithinimicrobium cerasi]|uniref:Transcriptional regulator, AraC family n=1 Tax=Ornithinimicrobium cerasi TaxID=2248773 RepID=A0A285VK85_9MICO|nr:AraC family transcriptional regulator [Ornithinimicrobium cerasi]SOC53948.1 transcriptional regulator, AraC family [Ornithinimicrobium cerasi]
MTADPRPPAPTGRAPGRVPGDVLVHLRRARDHIDRSYPEPLDLDALATVAGLSKYHFLRLFRRTYGRTPGAYLSERRVERAQDLLRSTNLTVTEVCLAVGFSSLGSFSSRFHEITGETPSAFQRRYAVSGAPRIPGCYVLMWGLAERRRSAAPAPAPDGPDGSATEEKPAPPDGD